MAKPILLTVDDDADVVRGIERDLRSHYGAQYRVLASDSPEGALDLLNQLKLRSDSVAPAACRPAHAKNGWRAVSSESARAISRSQARVADRVCRYKCRYQRYQ
jgi:hypothetical protein